MIISGGSRSNWRFFAGHLVKTTENERVTFPEFRGLAADTVKEAFREMSALASATRCKNFFYHANLNPRADELLTPEQWETAVDTLETELGLVGHSRFIVEHEKDGRTHRHVVWSRINPDTMTATSDSQNFAAHERASRALERVFGQAPVVGAHGRDGKRPKRRAKNWETFRGHGTGIDPAAVTREVTSLWQRADSGKAFAASLAEHGYILCRGDRRDYCLVDRAGDVHSLARRIDGAKAAEIRTRLADLDPNRLPTTEQAREGFLAKPLAAEPQHAGMLAASHAGPHTQQPATTIQVPVPRSAPASADPEDIWKTGAPSPLEAFARRVSDAMHVHGGAPPPPGLPPRAFNSKPRSPAVTLLEVFARTVTTTMRRNGGDVSHRDGLVWWERAASVLEKAREALGWNKGHWQDHVERSREDDHDLDR